MFFKLLKDAFKIKQVRSKILFTIFIILVFRIGTTITVPGVNAKSLEALSGFFEDWATNIICYML